MAKSDELIAELSRSVEEFNKSLPSIQDTIFEEIELLIKELKVKDGSIVQSVENLKLINRIADKINQAVLTPEYQQSVTEFGKSFNTVTTIQTAYFNELIDDFTLPEILKEIKKQSITDTVAALTEAGLEANLSDKISQIIKQNIESGAKYSDLTKELRLFIKGNEESLGALEKYAGQITTDAINTYSRTYNKIITDDLGLTWFRYVGALVGDSRDICEALVAKDFVNESELPEILKGKVDGKQVPIYKKTGLPYGMIPGTNVNNFQQRCGGYRCEHQLLPIPEERVPKAIRDKFKK